MNTTTRKPFRVKSVIFDMDGVITNTMPDHFRAWHKVLLNEGIHASQEDIYSREGQYGLQSVREIFQEHRKPFILKEAKKILRRKEDLFKKNLKTRFVIGSRTLIKKLKRKGITLALVTGTSRHELHRALPAELFNNFSVTITGNDVKNGKPHPEPYRRALKQLRLKAKDAVVIENAPFGIRSAKKAGLKCFALETSLPKKYLVEADRVFKSIKELEKNIKFFNHV